MVQKNLALVGEGKLTDEEFETICADREVVDHREVADYISQSLDRAEKAIAQAKKGEHITDINEDKVPVLDVKGLSGVDILKQCGVEKPFAAQKERKGLGELFGEMLGELGLGSGSESESELGMFGFSEDDVMELACQGVKPWDDDAGSVLAALRGH